MPPKQSLTPELEAKLKELFFDETLQGLANPKQLQSYAKANNTLITQAIAKEFIEKQASAQRFTRLKKQNLFVPVTAPKWTYQIDTLTIAGKYIIVLIEITSRKVYSRVVKDHSATTAGEAIEDMIKQIKAEGNDIVKIESDSGTEFFGRFDTVLKKYNIEHYRYPSTDSSNTALSKVERVNGTIRSFYEQKKEQDRTKTVGQIVPQVTRFYNNREHSATKKTPNEFEEDDFAPQRIKELSKGLEPVRKIIKRYPIGAKVRIAEHTTSFDKGAKPKWSEEIYTISRKVGYSFYVQDKDDNELPKPFRAWELLPTTETPKQEESEEEEEEEEPQSSEEEEEVPLVRQRAKRTIKEKQQFEVQHKPVKKRAKKQLEELEVEAIRGHTYGRDKKLYLLTKYKGKDNPTYQPVDDFIGYTKKGERIINEIADNYLKSNGLEI